jgi:hypothetical protein
MNYCGFAKRHLWRGFAIGRPSARSVIFEKFSKFRLGYAEM